MRNRRAGAQRRPLEVHRKDPRQHRGIEAVTRRLALDAGIVDEDIEPSPGRQQGVDHRRHGRGVRHVGRGFAVCCRRQAGGRRRGLAGGQRLGRRLGIAHMVDRHGGALPGEGLGDGTADAARATGDEGKPFCETKRDLGHGILR